MYYKLNDDKSVIPCTLDEWSNQAEAFHRNESNIWRVAEDTVNEFWVSTVFLGMDHQCLNYGLPLLFETMVFDSKENLNVEEYQKRYSNYEQALEGHKKAIEWVKNRCKDELE